MEYKELVEMRDEFDSILSSRSGMKASQKMIFGSIRMLETLAVNFSPIKCHGLSNLMLNDEDVIEDIKHISLRQMGLVEIRPEMRLGYKVMQNILALHNANSTKLPEQDSPKLNNINEKYSDL